MICFLQYRMTSAKQFCQFDHIIIALAHLSTVNGDHIIMYPVTNRRYMITNCALCNFTFMMWKQKIHSTPMDIELFPEVFCAHSRAFNMPTGETNTPRAFPAHDVFR